MSKSLRQLEWLCSNGSINPLQYGCGEPDCLTCPACDELQEDGHAPDCWLARLIAQEPNL